MRVGCWSAAGYVIESSWLWHYASCLTLPDDPVHTPTPRQYRHILETWVLAYRLAGHPRRSIPVPPREIVGALTEVAMTGHGGDIVYRRPSEELLAVNSNPLTAEDEELCCCFLRAFVLRPPIP